MKRNVLTLSMVDWHWLNASENSSHAIISADTCRLSKQFALIQSSISRDRTLPKKCLTHYDRFCVTFQLICSLQHYSRWHDKKGQSLSQANRSTKQMLCNAISGEKIESVAENEKIKARTWWDAPKIQWTLKELSNRELKYV